MQEITIIPPDSLQTTAFVTTFLRTKIRPIMPELMYIVIGIIAFTEHSTGSSKTKIVLKLK